MAKLLTITIFIAIFTSGITHIHAACDERKVMNKIFAGYNSDARPVREQATPVIVQAQIFIFGIVNINEQEESISLLLWTRSVWKDEYLSWNVSEPDQNCTEIKIRANKMWLPNGIFTNTLDIKTIVPSDQQLLSISNEGIANMTVASYVTLRCTMRITDFPFDTQSCPIKLTVWTYEYKDLQLTLYSPASLSDILGHSSEFRTISYEAVAANDSDKDHIYSQLSYSLVLKRIPEYYVYVIIIPTVVLTTLCIIGIFTPNANINERNEKVTIGMTTLLSMAVILNIVADQMPKSSEGLPLLGYFVLYEIGMCTGAIILSTFVILLHQRAHTRAWRAPRMLFRLTQTKPFHDEAVNSSYMDNRVEDTGKLHLVKNARIIEEQADNDKMAKMINATKKLGDKLVAINSVDERRRKVKERREITAKVWMKTVDIIDSFILIILLLANSILVWVVFS